MSAEAIWVLAERPSGEHIAQLYSHETVLIESLRMFTTHGLLRGEAVLLVLTPSHRQVLLPHLKDNVKARTLQSDGTYRHVPLPSGETPFNVQEWLLSTE